MIRRVIPKRKPITIRNADGTIRAPPPVSAPLVSLATAPIARTVHEPDVVRAPPNLFDISRIEALKSATEAAKRKLTDDEENKINRLFNRRANKAARESASLNRVSSKPDPPRQPLQRVMTVSGFNRAKAREAAKRKRLIQLAQGKS